jgi:hypothetical protein
MGFTGWYKHPTLLHLFWLVVAVQVALLIWGLRRTASAGVRYWGQVGAGTAMSAVAAVLIFAGSLLFTVVVFPDYFEELRTIQAEMLRQAGKTESEVRAAIDGAAAMQTPLAQALAGAIGTVVTGFVTSLVIGAFCRARLSAP